MPRMMPASGRQAAMAPDGTQADHAAREALGDQALATWPTSF